jgi:ABC-type bacteriocin/lantibiotic exporter with double-glycine peptidase domain
MPLWPSTDPNALLLSTMLGHLFPDRAPSERISALEQASGAESFEQNLRKAVKSLGSELVSLDTSLSDLQASDVRFPVVNLSESPRLLLPRQSGWVVVDERGETSASSLLTPKEPRLFMVSPLLELACLGNRSPISRLLSYLRKEKAFIGWVFIYAVGIEIVGLAIPLTVQVLTNTIGIGLLVQPLVLLSLILLGALTLGAALRVFQLIVLEHMSRRFMQRLVLDLSTRLSRLTPRDDPPVHRFFEFASVDKSFLVLGLDFIAATVQLFTAMVLLAAYHPLLLGFAVLLALFSYLAVRVPFRAALQASLDESREKYAIAAALSRGDLNDAGARSYAISSWLHARGRGFRLTLLQQLGLMGVQVAFSVLLLLLGGWLVIQGQLSLGQLVAGELVATAALASLAKLGRKLPKVYDLITSFEKLGKLVDESPSQVVWGRGREAV